MNRLNVFAGLLICLLAAPALAEREARQSPEIQEMNRLAEAAMQMALKAVEESGGVYPFAILAREGDNNQILGYQGEREAAPPPGQWVEALFLRLQEMTRDSDKDLRAVALVRLHEVPSKDGDKVPGIWVQVDHRNERPWVLFLPFVRNEAGRHEAGELIYYASEQPIFPALEPDEG